MEWIFRNYRALNRKSPRLPCPLGAYDSPTMFLMLNFVASYQNARSPIQTRV